MQSSDALGDIYGRAQLGYAALCAHGRVVEGNRCFAKLIGADFGELPTQPLRTFMIDADRDRFDQWLAQAYRRAQALATAPESVNTALSCELRLKRGEGYFWARLIAVEAPASEAASQVAVLINPLDHFRHPSEQKDNHSEKYRDIFFAIPHPMWVFDTVSLRVLAVNDAALATYGYSRTEFLSMTIKDIRPDDDIPRLLEELASVQPVFRNAGIWRHKKKDGALIWVEVASHALEFDGYQARLVHAHDVTLRVHTEYSLRVSDQALKAVSQGVLISGADRRITSSNAAFSAITGYSEEETIGRTCTFLQGPGTNPDTVAAIRRAFAAGTEFAGEILNYHKNGSPFWNELTISPVCDEAGTLIHYIGVTRDISARKQAERLARESELRLALAIRGGDLGLWDWTAASGDLQVNDRWLSILGLDPDGPRPTIELWHSLVHPEDMLKLDRLFQEVILNPDGKELEAEIRARHRDGHYVWILDKGRVAERAADGSPLRIVGTHMDISARKQAELKLVQQAELLDRTGEMAKVGGWSLDVESMELTWTRETFRIAGVDPSLKPDVEGAIEMYALEARPIIAAAVQTALSSGTPYDLELPLISAKGRHLWVHTTGFADRRDDKIFRISGTFQDITERKNAQAVQSFLAHTGGKSDEPFFLALARFLGQTPDVDFVEISQFQGDGRFALPLAVWSDGQLSTCLNSDPGLAFKDWALEHRHRDITYAGTALPFAGTSDEPDNTRQVCARMTNQAGEPIGLIIVGSREPLHDRALVANTLTMLVGRAAGELQRLKAEIALRESESKLRRIVNGFGPNVFTWLLAPDGRVLMVNESALAVVDLPLGNVLNERLFETAWFSRAQPARQIVEVALQQAAAGIPSRFDVQISAHRQPLSWVDFSLHPVSDESGQVAYLVCSAMVIEERKRAEADLLAAKTHLQTTLDAIPDLVFEVNADGRLIKHHSQRPELLAAVPGEFLGETIADVLPADAAEVCMRAIAEALQAGWSAGAVYRLPLADGDAWYELSVAAMPNTGEHDRHLIVVTRNITDRKQALRQLRASERALAETLRSLDRTAAIAKVGGWELEAGSSQPYWSPETFRIHEVEPPHTPPLDVALTFYPPAVLPTIQAALDAAFTRGTPWDLELPLITAKGRHIWVRTQCTAVIENGKVTRLLGALHDISTRKQAEEALLREKSEHEIAEAALAHVEEKFRAVIDVSPVPMALNDAAGNITFLNPSFVQIFGYNQSDIPTLEEWWPKAYPDPDYRSWVTRAWNAELQRAEHPQSAFVPMELKIRCKDGSDRYVSASAAALSNAYQDTHLVLLYDITERRSAEEALRETADTLEQRVLERTKDLEAARALAERAQLSKTRFFAAASHDLLQPLNAARIFASNLSEQSDLPVNAARIAERIDAALRGAEEVIDALVGVAKLETGAVRVVIEDFDLHPLLQGLMEQFSGAAEQRHLRLRLGPCQVVVRSDPRLLRRVLQNLISNALRYTAHGGVLVGVRRARGGQVRIDVVDTGLGIPEESMEEVFEEFRRGGRSSPWGEKGLGLGLSMCKRKCALLGHELTAVSRVNRGSTFSVHVGLGTLAKRHHPEAVEPLAEGPPQPRLDLRILCVDDDADVLDAMVSLLISWGTTCQSARSGSGALESAKLNKPDVVLVDYQFDGEDSTSGIEMVAAMRKLYPDEPPAAILITANRSSELQALAKENGISLLQKPLRAARLRSLLEALSRT